MSKNAVNKNPVPPQPLRVLLVEDSEDDALLILRELKKAGFAPDFSRVDSRDAMASALRERTWDIILADYSMPGFSGLQALTALHTMDLDIPFIVISGTIGEDVAVSMMKAGAGDYIMKDALARLGPAAERELREAENRRQRRASDLALQASERRYKEMAEMLPEILYEADLSGRLTYTNQMGFARMGYTPEDFAKGINILQTVIPSDRERVLRILPTIFSGTPTPGEEYTALRRDGSTFPIIIQSTRIVHDGNVVGLRGVIMDITERKRAAEQLYQADKLASLGTLVAGVAHEISNPNMFIMLNAPVLRDLWTDALRMLEARDHETPVDPAAISELQKSGNEALANIVQGAERIKHIVQELKDFAREQPTVLVERVDVNRIIRSAVTLTWNRIKNTTDHFQADYSPELPAVQGNAQRIEQVIINLIVNACDAITARTQAVRVSSAFDAERDTVVIRVADEGSGMTPETLARIFDPFFTTKRDGGGTGLGLSISSRVIEEHRGTLEYDSAPGRGTTAVVTLPVSRME